MVSFNETARRNFKRRLRRRRKETIESVAQADQQIERLLIRRFDRLVSVRRFIFLWLALFVFLFATVFLQSRALSNYYQVLKPVPGGLYSEGIVGSISNPNPLYASGAADVDLSRLIFSGLFKYNDQNQLSPDLATDWVVNSDQKQYTVHLRKNVTWQDGKPFNADDVVFTYKTIQNIEAQSPLYSSWQGISINKLDNYTVSFGLPNSLSAFPYSLTNGIIPYHLLKNIKPEELRSASFNTSPVGTGPFEWKFVDVSGGTSDARQQRVSLAAFDRYHFGHPALDGFSLITYSDNRHLLTAFENKQINAMSGLESLPNELAKDKSVHVYSTPLTTAVMAFFNNSQAFLSDQNVRKALVSGVDRSGVDKLFSNPVQPVDSPLLKNQLGYDSSIAELPYNFDYANQLLDQDGWTRDANGQRIKNGQPLVFSMASQDTQNYSNVAAYLQQQWAKLGVKVQVNYYDASDLQTSIISNHSYDVLLYGISVGVDPDEYAYWDSSQASLTSQGHLNLSEYKSTAADQSLEGGRTRTDPALRAAKYKAFLSAWSSDAPALALYQPNYIYITRGPVLNYQRSADNSSEDRFYNVADWMIRQQKKDIINR